MPQVLAQEPTFEQRLAKLADEFDGLRVAHHVPGAAIAIVKGDEVVLARGFGFADLENKKAVTPATQFAIGSTTKAFTSTLIGMLVDEGKMQWDDPADQYLPYFDLAVTSDFPDAKVTMRDLMSHRTGFPRMSMLWASGVLTPDQILHQAVEAEPYVRLRERFYYNNVMFLAAGWAGAAAGGASWHKLIDERILQPLQMNATRTSLRQSSTDPNMAQAYSWIEHADEYRRYAPSPDSLGVDAVAAAGSISSSVLDMSKWLRFLLADGEFDGQRLISKEALSETWSQQMAMGPGISYGLGWMIRDWQGQPLIEHGGSVPGGFNAEVGLLPESDLGFVVLTNSHPTLFAALSLNLVPTTLLGAWASDPSDGSPQNFGPLLGKYIANFATFSDETFTVVERNGHLALDIPSQTVYDLNPPNDEGKWLFTLTDTIAVSFERDESGDVFALKMHQSGMEFEALREGVEVKPEVDLDELQKYLGAYETTAAGQLLQIDTIIQNNRLAIQIANGPVFDLHIPDEDDRWVSRANSDLFVVFDETQSGDVQGMQLHRPGGAPVLSLTTQADKTPLLTVDQLMELRLANITSSAEQPIHNTRLSGSVDFPHAAVSGRYQVTTAGPDHLRIDIDMGRFGAVRVGLNDDTGSRDTTFDMEPFQELVRDLLEQIRLGHPSALYGDWRKHFDDISVLGSSELDGRAIYTVKLQQGDLPATKLSVDAQTGDVLQVESTILIPRLSGMPVITRNKDFHDLHGMRVAYHSQESNEQTGRTVYEIEEFEINIDLPNDFFTLKPARGQ